MPVLALIVSTFVPGGMPIVAAQERNLSHQQTVTEVWDYDGSIGSVLSQPQLRDPPRGKIPVH